MDVELVVRAQRGDVEAFTALVDAMGGRLHAAAYSILRDREAAADATQRALIAAWQGLPGLREPAAFSAWCYRMLIRSCHAEARRLPRWLPLDLEPELVASAGFDPATAAAHRDQLERGFRRGQAPGARGGHPRLVRREGRLTGPRSRVDPRPRGVIPGPAPLIPGRRGDTPRHRCSTTPGAGAGDAG